MTWTPWGVKKSILGYKQYMWFSTPSPGLGRLRVVGLASHWCTNSVTCIYLFIIYLLLTTSSSTKFLYYKTRGATLGALAILKKKWVTTNWDYGFTLGYHLVSNDRELIILRGIQKTWREN